MVHLQEQVTDPLWMDMMNHQATTDAFSLITKGWIIFGHIEFAGTIINTCAGEERRCTNHMRPLIADESSVSDAIIMH